MTPNAKRTGERRLRRWAWSVGVGMLVCAVAGGCASRSAASGSAANGVTSAGVVAPRNAPPENVGLEFDGVIGRIDVDKQLITVERWPLSRTFKVSPDCEVDISTNATATVAELRVNDPVRIAYAEVGKELVANRIVRRGKAYEQEQRGKMERLNDMLYPSPNQ
ncbi:MAG TPA: hypothetical protein VMP11_08120 [Verrucomicrobiae bacterium]|nr:hypothetical protein [Verrucomicrobiae bacterium]